MYLNVGKNFLKIVLTGLDHEQETFFAYVLHLNTFGMISDQQ
jgi:hypothetical protein